MSGTGAVGLSPQILTRPAAPDARDFLGVKFAHLADLGDGRTITILTTAEAVPSALIEAASREIQSGRI